MILEWIVRELEEGCYCCGGGGGGGGLMVEPGILDAFDEIL